MALRIPFNKQYWAEYLSGQRSQLPCLSDVSSVSDRVVRVLGGNPGHMQLQGTNTYIVGTGRKRILIDTGEGAPCWISRIVEYLEASEVQLAHVLLTHWHGDHTGGVPDLIAYDHNLATEIYKHQPDYFQKDIVPGQIFRVEGATLKAVFTPGHAVDHMCFHLEEDDALFTGDNVLGHGYSVMQDLGTYIHSLKVMYAEDCSRGYPGHGARIDNLPATLQDYLQHKETRVNQVYGLLTRSRSEIERLGQRYGGGMTVEEIVKSLYGNVPPELVEHALSPFLTQALWKLAEDLKVGFEPGDPKKRRWFARPINMRSQTV